MFFRPMARAFLRGAGVLLIVLGLAHLAATPHIPQLLSGSPPLVYNHAVGPTLLNHVLVGILLLPMGFTVFFASAAACRGEPVTGVFCSSTLSRFSRFPSASSRSCAGPNTTRRLFFSSARSWSRPFLCSPLRQRLRSFSAKTPSTCNSQTAGSLGLAAKPAVCQTNGFASPVSFNSHFHPIRSIHKLVLLHGDQRRKVTRRPAQEQFFSLCCQRHLRIRQVEIRSEPKRAGASLQLFRQ